jgi:hypothetical protein
MNEQNILTFEIPSKLNDTLNISGVPKAATIFCHENRWWFELKVGETWNNELDRRKKNFDWLKKECYDLNMALGPFGKKFSSNSYPF